MDFESYKEMAVKSVHALVKARECQPILFFGAGLSRRYIEAPGWHDALRAACEKMGADGPKYEYYLQLFSSDTIKIGTQLAKDLHQWAWDKGKNSFPAELYKASNADIFLKYLIASQLQKKLPALEKLLTGAHKKELEALRKVRAHAIITTNFDQLAETIFEGYEPIVGQKVLSYNTHSFGEIFKIHGCVSDLGSIVITQQDYDEFVETKTCLSAKLLAYFAEHPIFVFGYSFNDPNISAILSGVGKIFRELGKL